MDVGVFIPINNNGWLISTTSPQYKPGFDLNRTVVQQAERYGLDFALSMIKLHGFGGPSEFWDYGLESFTLMAGLASVTTRIKPSASIAVLTMPPPIAARMAVTIDSIAPGRFGVNIVSGWQKAEYEQMGIWPGADHFACRYQFCAEYVSIMRELWESGRSDFKGKFFQMDDCRLLPMPSARIPVICAAQSEKGTRFAAEHGDYNFCVGFGVFQDSGGRRRPPCRPRRRVVRGYAHSTAAAPVGGVTQHRSRGVHQPREDRKDAVEEDFRRLRHLQRRWFGRVAGRGATATQDSCRESRLEDNDAPAGVLARWRP